MYYKVYLLLAALIANAASISIDPKLNFGEDFQEPKVPLAKPNILENVTVTCDNNGCNSTRNETTDNDITANIVVQIKATAANNHTEHQPPEEIPDVPIVLGYAGLSESEKQDIDRRKQEEINVHIEPPSVVTLQEPPRAYNQQGRSYNHYGNSFNDIQFKESVVGLRRPTYQQQPLFYPSQRERYTYTGVPPVRTFRQESPNGWTTCTCRTEPRMSWARNTYAGPSPAVSPGPGAQINDKLAPLN